MGLFRKVTSISTLGAVDFRSDKERTAAYTRGSRKEARKQTAIQRAQLDAMHRQAPPAVPLAGWYPSPSRPGAMEWWDGARWTAQYR